MIKYAVYNPNTGINEIFETKELALENYWNIVIQLARELTHNTSYMIVEILDDGTERWYNDNNQEITKPRTKAEIEALIQAAIAAEQSNSQS